MKEATLADREERGDLLKIPANVRANKTETDRNHCVLWTLGFVHGSGSVISVLPDNANALTGLNVNTPSGGLEVGGRGVTGLVLSPHGTIMHGFVPKVGRDRKL